MPSAARFGAHAAETHQFAGVEAILSRDLRTGVIDNNAPVECGGVGVAILLQRGERIGLTLQHDCGACGIAAAAGCDSLVCGVRCFRVGRCRRVGDLGVAEREAGAEIDDETRGRWIVAGLRRHCRAVITFRA